MYSNLYDCVNVNHLHVQLHYTLCMCRQLHLHKVIYIMHLHDPIRSCI
jgi:hypothetical protein